MKCYVEGIFSKICTLTILIVLFFSLSNMAFGDEFKWGVGQYGAYFDIDEVTELGASWYRSYVVWNEIEPKIKEKRVDLGRLEELIEEYLETKNWETTDNMVDELVNNGIEPFLVIGVGFDDFLPIYQTRIANPAVLGPGNYITHLYLHTRAVVRRYRDRVHYWQMENQLNEAKIALLVHKTRSGYTWNQWEYLTGIMRAIRDGVKTEDPNAQVTTALHTDIPDEIHEHRGTKTWREALTDWWGFVDIIGLSIYPNNRRGLPVLGEVVGQRVAQAMPLARDKQVIVMEAGYPSGPSSSYTEANQSLFVEEAANAVQNNGGLGFFYSPLYSCDCGKNIEDYQGLIGGPLHHKKQAWHTYYDIIHPTSRLDKFVLNVGQTTPRALNTTLLANYPNPFNPETWLPYSLVKDADVIITIYDIHGRIIRRLTQGRKPAGTYLIRDKAAYWDGRDDFGQLVAGGVYYYTLQVRPVSVGTIPSIGAGDFSMTRKMMIVK